MVPDVSTEYIIPFLFPGKVFNVIPYVIDTCASPIALTYSRTYRVLELQCGGEKSGDYGDQKMGSIA
jgi:hypothetical protein